MTVLLSLLFVILLATVYGRNADRLNILMIIADDHRPEIASWFNESDVSMYPRMVTPNLDELSAKSIIFKRAYSQQTLCSPSRSSFMTSRRPDTTHVYDLRWYFRDVGGNFSTIPQYFKDYGYTSVGIGKIFHPGMASNNDDPLSWSEPYYHATNLSYWSSRAKSWYAVPRSERDDHELPDTELANYAIETIARLTSDTENQQPFFMALGFYKPHLPFVFPQEMLNLYPAEKIELPENPDPPIGMPIAAWYDYGEIRVYNDIKALNLTGAIGTHMPSSVVLELRRAYYAAISHVDIEIGRVLRQLEDSGIANNTIVVFLSDHGWHLGEHGEWSKLSNFELAARVPLMFHIPGKTDDGMLSQNLVELVDIFPTLSEAAGLPTVPRCPDNSSNIEVCTEGCSLMPLIDGTTLWKDRSFSQHPRSIPSIGGNVYVMGYSMRTPRYRYTEWVDFAYDPVYKPDWNVLIGVELYDDELASGENINFADFPDFKELRQNLSSELHLGWKEQLCF